MLNCMGMIIFLQTHMMAENDTINRTVKLQLTGVRR